MSSCASEESRPEEKEPWAGSPGAPAGLPRPVGGREKRQCLCLQNTIAGGRQRKLECGAVLQFCPSSQLEIIALSHVCSLLHPRWLKTRVGIAEMGYVANKPGCHRSQGRPHACTLGRHRGGSSPVRFVTEETLRVYRPRGEVTTGFLREMLLSFVSLPSSCP